MIDAFRDFAGQGLTFGVTGPGVAVDPATGRLAISSDALVSGVEVVVTAGTAAGGDESRFRVTVTPLAVARPPVAVVAPTLRGSGEVGSAVAVDPGQWTGEPAPELALQWRAGGVAIEGATEASYLPGPAEDGADLDCLVTATNASGSAALAAGPLRVSEVPPAVGAIPDLALTLGGPAGRVEAAGYFTGRGLSFSVEGAGATIDAVSGAIRLSTDEIRVDAVVTVTARNSGGAAAIGFRVSVAAVAPAVATPPALRGSGAIGAAVEVDPGRWTGEPAPEVTLQWRAAGVAIPGATGAAFVPGPAEDGVDLDCLVTATNAAGSAVLAAGPLRVTQAAPEARGAIADLELRQGASPEEVQAAGYFSGTGLSFSVAGAGATIDAASGIVSVPTDALLDGEPVVVTARNSGGSASSQFRVAVIPAKLDPGRIQISEITDAADPAKGKGGRRRLVVGDVTVPSGYQLRWSSPTQEGGIPPGTAVAANTTLVRNDSLSAGVVNYNVLYWCRLSDGACFNALPPAGRTGNGKAITPTAANPADGQVVLPIGGVAPVWPSLGDVAVSDAIRFPLAEFSNKGGTGSNITQSRNAYVAAAYESFRGTVSTDAFVLSQLDRLLDGRCMPAGMSGPAASREASAITFFQLVKLTPRLYDPLPASKKSQMEWIVRALLVVHAWMGADGHPDGPGGSDWFLTGFDDGVGVKSVGPNIAFGLVANIVNAACYLGPVEALNFLNSVTMADLRARIGSLFGTTSLLYRTLNWRNEGVSASAATSFYRAAASSLAPPDATVESALRNFRYYGAALPDLQAILLPNDTRGLNRCIPPANWTAQGSNTYIGIAQHACLGNAGLLIGTTIHGACLNKATGMPHLGNVGCMIYELNGIDAGGIRSSMGYASWTKAVVDCVILSLAVSEAIDLASPAMSDFLIRWNKANAILNHFDDNDYRSCSHNEKDSSGKVIGTKPGGPARNVLWSADRDLFAMPAHRALWEAIRAKLAIPSA